MFEKYSSPHHGVGTIVDVSIDVSNVFTRTSSDSKLVQSNEYNLILKDSLIMNLNG